ncbi:hypothetical protein AOQ84DRAFT_293719 [Glonium stellatum]|uniref:SP-RING-type domain-containing protein n=1 Tax=Glonium stellatum TaxID=574774 RepID=A0A8E2F075_9PEZI|nr:hypothetical protein AOQ84DRAFT_293719 [Glonium stellatum]
MTAGCRRPEPDSAAASASASTLNHFLGGKQKPWMVSGTQSVPLAPATQSYARPANRTNVYIAPQPNKPPTARILRSQSQEHLERHPASNSTSPQLANILSPRKDAITRPSAGAILPSPAPSDDLNTDSIHNGTSRTEDGVSRGITTVGNIPDHNSSGERQNGVSVKGRQMVTARKRPLESDMPVANKRHAPESMQRATVTESGQLPVHGLLVQSQVINAERVRLQHEVILAQAQALAQAEAQGQAQAQEQEKIQAQASAQAEAQIRAEAAAADARQRHQHNQSPALQSPVPQSPVLTDNYFTSDDCNQPLQHLISRVGGMHGFPIRDGQRMRLLKEAVDAKDFAYLSIHQYFCLATVDYSSLPPNLRSLPALPKALDCISQVLDSNSNISPWLVQWFSNFPMPLGQIAIRWPTKYKQQQEKFARFAELAGMRFFDLKRRCVQRRYPPLVRELYEELGIVSAVFQRVVFLATLRSFWAPTSDQISSPVSQAENLFLQNQIEYNTRLIQKQTPQNPADIIREHENYSRQYKALPPSQLNISRSASNPVAQQQSLRRENPQVGAGRPSMPVASNSARVISMPQPVASTPPAQHQHHRQVHQQPRRGILFPPRGSTRAQPSQPNPIQSALHQAHLRSPILKPVQVTPCSSPKMLYRYVKGFALRPTIPPPNIPMQFWKFNISAKDFETVPTDQPGKLGEPPTRAIGEQTQTYRLRCIKWTAPRGPDEFAWMVADNSWLPYAYFKLNEHMLQPRKKLHNGKDLPIDLTPYLKEGENILEMAVLRQINDRSPLNCALAVEIVGVKNHEEIKQDCFTTNLVPSGQVKAAIKASLAGPDGDDEIAIVSSNITINLFDPFSACRIFDVPVRGRNCLHHDCFDLETFLQTRRRKQPTWPTAVDEWKCPLCKADVRPPNLIVDGFMEEVRAKLSEQNLLNTRAIVVEQDGSWKPKPEVVDKNGVQDRDSPDEDNRDTTRVTQSASAPPTSNPAPMVIDLSD